MAVLYDYECDACKSIFEASAEPEQKQIYCLNCQTGVAHRVYLRMSAMPGKNKGKFPAFDIQSGQTFQSSKDRDDYAHKRGRFQNRSGPAFEMQGQAEWNRSRNAPRTPDPMDSDEPDPRLIEIAKKAWDDVKYGRIAPEVEEARVTETIKQADFLDATKAPKVESVE